MIDSISKREREDYFLSHLEVVDRDFSAALYTYVVKYGESLTADEIKHVAITYYIYAWHNHFKLLKDDPLIGLVIGKIEFPPTFDRVVDKYIEEVKGHKPTFSYKEVIDLYEPKVNPLGLFR